MSEQPTLSMTSVGFALPALIIKPTTRQLVQYAGASGDFYEIHYDKDFAIAQDLPGVIIHGALKSAWIAQVVTDWMGPAGTLKAFSVRYRDMDVPGDTLTCTATVVEKDDEACTVRCEITMTNSAGNATTTGDAVVALPRD
jgi:acyl dehydratase